MNLTNLVPRFPRLFVAESALTHGGLAPEGRKFHPHVSLARGKSLDGRRIAEFEIVNSLFRLTEIPVQEFVLCSSELRPEGAVHTVEETYALDEMLEGEQEENGSGRGDPMSTNPL